MAYSSEFHMPGGYHFDNQNATGPALSAGLFRAPAASPSAASSVFNLTGSLHSETTTPANSAAKRKRNNIALAAAEATRESAYPQDWSPMNVDGAATPDYFGDPHQMQYTLAGRIGSTPNGERPMMGMAMAATMEDSVYSDVDYRRAAGSKRPREDTPCSTPGKPNAVPNQLQRLGIFDVDPNINLQQSQTKGWRSFAFNTIGGVFGKVWEFCKAGAFRGFYAGGGMGYNNLGQQSKTGQPSSPPKGRVGNGRVWCNEHDVPTLQQDDEPIMFENSNGNHPLPDDRSPFADHSIRRLHEQQQQQQQHHANRPETPDHTSRRPSAKRRLISETYDDTDDGTHRPAEELRRNWVMVDDRGSIRGSPVLDHAKKAPLANTQTPSRAPSRAGSTRPSVGQQKQQQQQPPRYAAPTAASTGRRISVPVSRLGGASSPNSMSSRRATSTTASPAPISSSHAGSASLTAREPASFATPRSPVTTTTLTPILDRHASPSRIPVPIVPTGSLGPNLFAAADLSPGPAGRSNGTSLRPASPSVTARSSSSMSNRSSSTSGTTNASSTTTISTASVTSATCLATALGTNHLRASHRRPRSSVLSSPGHRRKTSEPISSAINKTAAAAAIEASSPRLDAEAKKLAARKLAEERNADARMEAFNAQLMQMIREGKEALGTRVTVEMSSGPSSSVAGGVGASVAGMWVDSEDEDAYGDDVEVDI